MTYLILFLEFFKIGLFAVGGGLATLPFLSELAGRYPWFDEAMLGNMIAVSQSTPGPIGINMATYAGFNAGGNFRWDHCHCWISDSICYHYYYCRSCIKSSLRKVRPCSRSFMHFVQP